MNAHKFNKRVVCVCFNEKKKQQTVCNSLLSVLNVNVEIVSPPISGCKGHLIGTWFLASMYTMFAFCMHCLSTNLDNIGPCFI